MDGNKPAPSLPPFPLRRGVLIGAVALGLAGVVGGYVSERERASRPLTFSGPSELSRRIVSLRAYDARRELGSLVPQTDAILSIREQFLQDVIDRSLPLRQSFKDGRYVARLDSAAVRLESGLATVTLAGRGMLAGQENSQLYADLLVRGLVTITGVSADSGTLQAALVITDVRARRARPQDLQTLLNPAAGYFGRLRAEDWNRQGQILHLPLRVERELVLPAIDGDVTVPESRVPISVRVSAVTTLERRMAVSLELLPDSTNESIQAREQWASRVAAHRPALWFPRWSRAFAEQESLLARIGRLARHDRLWRAVTATDHDVVMVVPAPLVRTIARRVARRYLKGVTVDVRPESHVHLDKELRVKILGGKVGVGRFQGTIHISHLAGELSIAGDPRVTFEPPSELAVTARVRVLAGRGNVSMNVEWNPATLVSPVCGGFRFQEKLAGEILPFADDLTTRIRYTVHDSSIVGWPSVQRDTIRFPADLTDRSWGKVRDRLVEQDRFSRCGMVMNADSVLVKLRTLAAQGVKVRLPPTIFKPFELPVVLEKLYVAGDYRIEARAFDPAIEVSPEYLRLAFRASLRVRAQLDTVSVSEARRTSAARLPR